jgi:hypothetical protein
MSHFDVFREEVERIADVTTYKRPTYGIEARKYGEATLLRGLRVPPYSFSYKSYDFVVCDFFPAFACQSWRDISIPKGIILEDLHGQLLKRIYDLILEYGADVVFHRYQGRFVPQWMEFIDGSQLLGRKNRRVP